MEPAGTFLTTTTVSSSMETTGNTNRLGPLHTCGTAMITTAYKAYKKTENLPGPLGSTTQNLATFFGPILYIIQYHWLAILSMVDDLILTVENVVETLFPPSTYVFDKIDALVRVSETLPRRFDNAVDKFPAVIHRVPCLNWASAQLVIILNFLVTTLTYWVVDGANEKEIPIDINSHDQLASDDEEHVKQMETYKDILVKKKDVNEEELEYSEMGMKKDNETTTTYKTILEMGMKKEEDKKNEEKETNNSQQMKQPNKNVSNKKDIVSVKNEKQSDIINEEDPILKLFSAAGWYDM